MSFVENDSRMPSHHHQDVLLGIMEDGEHRNTSSSYSTLVSTLIPLLIISVPLLLTFLYLRVKLRRVYAPRTFIETLHEEEKTPKLEKTGFVNWFPEFWHRPDEELLDHQNLDGYLFVRFLGTIARISLIGFALTLPLLIVNYMGAGRKSELARLTISNVVDPNVYYLYWLIATLFFGYVMYVITRETLYYINLRYAYYLTPRNAIRISSRTVLFTSVPFDWRDEKWLRAEFDEIDWIWIATDCKELEKLVRERDTTAFKLEDAEVKLLTTAVTKTSERSTHSSYQGPDVTSHYIRSDRRPKTKSMPLIGQERDAVLELRLKLQNLIPKVRLQQQNHLEGRVETIPAVFINFKTQRAAQAAFQTRRGDQPGNMESRTINTLPDDIIWKNLGIGFWSRAVRTFIAHTIIILLILFWSIPVGLVGALADIDSLVDQVPFLSFINKVPVPILGAVRGLLPALLISVLLALVPIVCRFLATQAGAISLAQVELRTQSWYFAFQVIQVFLITTFSSGASSVAKKIFEDPTKATSLLAKNLPQASNFYLSYFMLQGLTVAASEIFQVLPLLMFTLGGKVLDKTPRAKYNRWTALNGISWGDTYPKMTNLAVIGLSYSCIAPLTLGFAAAGLGLLYLAFRYNVFYAVSTATDTKGDAYGRALQHLTVGVYLAELCLIGLFTAKGGKGPAQLTTLVFVLLAIYHVYLNWVLSPLVYSFTDKLLADDEQELLNATRMENGESGIPEPRIGSLIHANLGTKKNQTQTKLSLHRERGGYFSRYLFHGPKSPYTKLRAHLSSEFPGIPAPSIPQDIKEEAYLNPATTAKVPTLWIPKDRLGVSTDQIKELQPIIAAVDTNASLDDKGKLVWDQEKLKETPLWKERFDL